MVFKYVFCDSWVIQLVPERHLGGWQDSFIPAPPSTPGAYSAMPSRSRPVPCLQQMWFTGQGSLLKQLSTNGRFFSVLLSSRNPLWQEQWSPSVVFILGASPRPPQQMWNRHLFCPFSTLLDASAFILAFFSKPWLWHGTKSDLPWLGCQGGEPFLLNAQCLLESPYKWLSYLIHNHFTCIHNHIQLTHNTHSHTHIHTQHIQHTRSHTVQQYSHTINTHTTHTLTYNAHIFTPPKYIHSHTLKYTHTLTCII